MTITHSFDRSSLNSHGTTNMPVKHAITWAFPDVASDIIVDVGGLSFALHKFPLVSRCGLLRMLVTEEGEASKIQLEGVPGGAEGFELAAKFCYGINVDISKYNVALLRCVAEFLDMSEEHGEDNLVFATESFLERLGKQTFKDVVTILHTCENLLPMAEDLKIVSRCIEWAAVKAVAEQELSQDADHYSCSDQDAAPGDHHNNNSVISYHDCPPKIDGKIDNIDWWAEDLSILRIDLYQRVLAALRARGLRTERVGGALVHYAHRSLKGLAKKLAGLWDPNIRSKLKLHDVSTAMEHEQRILVETIVSLLPREKNVASISFLMGLLRTASFLETTLACRLDLERRIGMQLHRATLDDLLIPSTDYNAETLFDVDTVHRIVASFVEQQLGDDDHYDINSTDLYEDMEGLNSPTQNPMIRVGRLVDGYLAEIAADGNLSLSKFVALAELLPEYARSIHDALYRAVDIYLKAHPGVTDVERKKLCKLLDFQKMSQDACTHAAQNERLPLQAVVQVLYCEQMRIRTAMGGPYVHPEGDSMHNLNGVSQVLSSAALSPKDHYASVRRENRELKLEVARMRMRLNELEKDHVHMKHDMEKSHHPYSHHHSHGHHHHTNLLRAVTKSFNKLNPFHHHHHHHNHHPQQADESSHSGSHAPSSRRAPSLSSAPSMVSCDQQAQKDSRRRRVSLS